MWPRGVKPDAFIGRYVWEWRGGRALAVGLISMMNHSSSPNTGSRRIYARRRIECYAMRDIGAGEQVLIDYGYDPGGHAA